MCLHTTCSVRTYVKCVTLIHKFPQLNGYVLACTYVYTVEPLLKDTLNKGHHRNYLSTKDTSLDTKNRLSYIRTYSANTFHFRKVDN